MARRPRHTAPAKRAELFSIVKTTATDLAPIVGSWSDGWPAELRAVLLPIYRRAVDAVAREEGREAMRQPPQ